MCGESSGNALGVYFRHAVHHTKKWTGSIIFMWSKSLGEFPHMKLCHYASIHASRNKNDVDSKEKNERKALVHNSFLPHQETMLDCVTWSPPEVS